MHTFAYAVCHFADRFPLASLWFLILGILGTAGIVFLITSVILSHSRKIDDAREAESINWHRSDRKRK